VFFLDFRNHNTNMRHETEPTSCSFAFVKWNKEARVVSYF